MSTSSFNWQNLHPKILWYIVGLVTSDGSLSKDGRHIDITAKDQNYLLKIKEEASLRQRIAIKSNGRNGIAARLQIGSIDFYKFLLSIGLAPNKSKIIGILKVPPQYFSSFLRGLIDGDGELRTWNHPSNGREQWALRIVSGSKVFLIWLQKMILEKIGASGRIYHNNIKGHETYVLKFGKLAAAAICHECYLKEPDILYLDRKFKLAQSCVLSKKGWSRSKTLVSKTARVVELVDTQDSRDMGLLRGNTKVIKLGELGEA